jgi:deoxyhypusine synthase
MTLSGAMTVAKQGSMVCEMIDRGMVQAVISTGALMAHGLTESIGLAHYRYDPSKSDKMLFDQGYNRIYDTLEMESNLNEVEVVVRTVLEENAPPADGWCSHTLCQAIGVKLDQLNQGPGVLRSAYLKNCPVFIPAFTDSEIGLDVATWAMKQALKGRKINQLPSEEVYQAVPPFNPFLDLQAYARLIGSAKRLGIFTIGGGVPRNWAQQVAPYYDITNHRVGTDLAPPRFQFAVRLCPEPVHWGGLSGCTYSEGVSWGKFVSPADGGRFAEVACDATAVWPLLLKAACEELDRER